MSSISMLRTHGLSRFAAPLLLAALLLAGCNSGTKSVGPSGVGALATLTLTPDPVVMARGGTQQFAVVGKDADGNVVTVTPTWSVVASGGTISSLGLFTAGTVAGSYTQTVKATSGSISGTATVTVTTGDLAGITVTPSSDTLAIGGTRQFTATGTDSSGNVIVITPTWSVVAGGGTINSAGLFTAGTVDGTFPSTVKATSGTISATVSVTVASGALATVTITPNPVTLPTGSFQQFTATGKDASGNAIAITPTFSVATGGGTITSAGLFHAGLAGGTFPNTIKATTSRGVTGYASVTVVAGVLASITISPNPVTLAIGSFQQFTATGTDADGNLIAITPTWSVEAGGGTINSSSGVFSAGTTAGTYPNTVKATSGTVSATATVTVASGLLATITVTPNPDTLLAGSGTRQFTATGKDASGNVIAVTPTWSVVAGGGTISSSGLFTAGTTAGTYPNTVRATSGTISGTATVTLTPSGPGPLATITVTPNPDTLGTGETQQFTATGKDADGNVVAVTPTWSVVALGGSINSSGLFTAGTVAGTFLNTVRATSGTISGTATVTVTRLGPAAVNLGTAGNYVILAKSGISTTGATSVVGDIGVSPVAATGITGFTLSTPPTTFTTSPLVTGKVWAADYDAPTPSNLTTAVLDMQTAYTDAAGRTLPDFTELGAGNISGMTLVPGLYKWGTGVLIDPSGVTLAGGANAVWIFQIAQDLTVNNAAIVTLIGGAQAKNIFWQVAGQVTLGTTADFKGIILSQTLISFNTGAKLKGRALAQTAVTLNATAITTP